MREPAWMTNAYAEIGLKEKDGALNEPRVIALYAETGNAWVKDDAVPWCGAFVGAMFARAGRSDVRPPGEKANALRAREWLKVGSPTQSPRSGDICVFSRGNNAIQGHVAFYVEDAGDKIKVLGGNQSNKVSVAAYPKSRLLGFRRVAELAAAHPSIRQPPKPSESVRPSQPITGPIRQPDDPGVEPGEKPAPMGFFESLAFAFKALFRLRGSGR